MLIRETINDRQTWNDNLREMPAPHILQSWEWGDFKLRQGGWQPLRWAYKRNDEIVALVNVGMRRVGPFALMYASKGPILRENDPEVFVAILSDLENEAKRQRAIWLKIDPDIIDATGEPGAEDEQADAYGQQALSILRSRRWAFSEDQVQFRNTVILDLTPDEDTILMSMSQNTRRKVRQAEKKGVTIRPGTSADFALLYDLYSGTSSRDGFLIRPYTYYEDAWRTMLAADQAQIFIAEYEGQAIAHVILFRFGARCWYFYGASADAERERMPNYALQWEAIRWAKAQGCTSYDFWGAPDEFNESDRMWGVYQFKRGFRGTATRHIGAWDYSPWPLLYRAYTQGWPRLRALLRRRGG